MTTLIKRTLFAALISFFPLVSAAQNVWIQIEARPSLEQAQDRVQAYSGALDNVNGFALRGGWYGIALGPYGTADADALLRQLRAAGQIPRDSFIADGSRFARQFWPVGGIRAPQSNGSTAPAEPVALPEPVPSDETPAQARRSEAHMSRQQRMELQTALQYAGAYTGAIDGAYGRGTRGAMADWQIANGYEATGVLTSKQRAQALKTYHDAVASLGLAPISDQTAGVEITLPTALVEFDRYDPPFAHYSAKQDGGPQILLISQSGDTAMFGGLYDILQTLDAVPLNGERTLKRTTFEINGQDERFDTTIYAELSGEQIKGFGLIWPAGDAKRRALALDAMRASFRSTDAVLPDIYGDTPEQSIDLLAGLEIRRPDKAATGVFVTEDGQVLTSAQTVASCGRVTIEDDVAMTVAAATGDLALLRPTTPVAPAAIAQFQPGRARLNSEIAIAGFSYGGRLGAPTLTYGTLAELQAPDGTQGVLRLALNSLDGDAGAAVFDTHGAVLGVLSAQDPAGRQLPQNVSLATDMNVVVSFLSDNGVAAMPASNAEPVAPEDLIRIASDMTVLVSCWN
ncbi:trypsin-like peptidase domain-containing protein [Aliiroseovarius sp. PTFE2010]|uniref:trypsin-like peptidase domain-containing protein n=1 Tax=Aliiroseovarius sp. PTFE2010 TaxID=3417190 RepID=UPI003CF25316